MASTSGHVGKIAYHAFKLCLFLLYIAILFYFLFFWDYFGRTDASMQMQLHYNFVPFREILRYTLRCRQLGIKLVLFNLGGNIVGFMPFGFFLPALFTSKVDRWWKAWFWAVVFSGGIEVLQLLTRVGSCDVDDVILNSTGALLGYILYRIRGYIRRSES
ncbi:MAG: VanZ family protein [Lachnospiraceae bacterium]|nr:VanZ family protein [Lachnospiraceae bacterium]